MFDKPIIILSSPRAGSTLLFEIMTSCKDVWTIGDESHRAIESIPSLRVNLNNFSNRLDEANITDEISEKIKFNFQSELRDRDKHTLRHSEKNVRFLEKTPKNSLRIPFLNKIFPDAYFIYLVRDPCENISSIMDAWNAGHWVTYGKLPGCDRPWSLLLPPNWESVKDKALANIAAFQWVSSNDFIINDLKKYASDRWTSISYYELVNDTNTQLKRLCNFCGIEFDERLSEVTSRTLPNSKYTLSKPTAGKWKKNENEIAKIFPDLKKHIDKFHKAIIENRKASVDWLFNTPIQPVSRNAMCPCGSGKKYKRCHGKPV